MSSPILTNPAAVVGQHWQPATGELLTFTGEAWWRPEFRQEQYMTAGMSSGARAALIVCGLLFFWPALLFLIGSGPKLAVRQVHAGFTPIAHGTPQQVEAAADELVRREQAALGQ